MERIRSNPLLRLLFTIVTGLASGAFFVSLVLLTLYIYKWITGAGG